VMLVLKNVLFTLVVPGTVGVYLPLVLTRGVPAKLGLTLPVSMGLFAIALAIYLWSVWNFASRGRGTPLPIDAPKRLVVQGPYLYTRNPMYLALFTALLGPPLSNHRSSSIHLRRCGRCHSLRNWIRRASPKARIRGRIRRVQSKGTALGTAASTFAGCLTTRWSRPGQPTVSVRAISRPLDGSSVSD
jgi:hypothetical protein